MNLYHKNEQKYLKNKSLVVFIGFLSAFIPLSIDLYLPALPGMAKNFNTSINFINLTLTLFFVFYAAGTLLWGPLSDKYGRRPILFIGLSIYTVSSFLCAYSHDVSQLIFFRIFQAIGGGASTAVAMAIVKDLYSGRKRETVLAVVQSLVMLAPIIAPIMGGILLQFTSWRGIFIVLGVFGVLGISGGFILTETINKKSTGNIFKAISRLGVVLKNPGFASLLLTFSFLIIPLMAFVSSSSYIYINGFGVSEQVYSYYFAFNAIFAFSGPILYLKLSKHFRRYSIIIICFLGLPISGLLVCIFGNVAPWLLAISVLPSTIAFSTLRPASSNLMLEQQEEDTGSASSLMSCSALSMGSVGIVLISFEWTNRILALGAIQLIVGLLCLTLWLYFSKKPFVKQIPDMIIVPVKVDGK